MVRGRLSLLTAALLAAALLAATIGLVDSTASAHAPHDVIADVAISPAFASDSTVLAISRGHVLRSTVEGKSWTEVSRGLEGGAATRLVIAPPNPNRVYVLLVGGGVYRSDDQGRSWEPTALPGGQKEISDVVVSPSSADVVYAAPASGGLYRTVDGGGNWDRIGQFDEVTALAAFGDTGVAVGDDTGAVRVSDDSGATWRSAKGLRRGDLVTALMSTNGPGAVLFAGTEQGRVYRSEAGAASFREVGSGVPSAPITSIGVSPEYSSDSTVWLSSSQVGTYRSTDAGVTFDEQSVNLVRDPQAEDSGEPDWGRVVVGTTAGRQTVLYLAGFSGLYRSTDGAESWSEIQTLADFTTALAVSPDYANDQSVLAGTYVMGMFRSTDRGRRWKPANDGLQVESPDESVRRIHSVAYSPDYARDGTIFLTSTSKVYVSTDRGRSWDESEIDVSHDADKPRFTIGVSPTFASDQTVYLGARSGELLRSKAGGASRSWDLVADHGSKIRSIVLSPTFSTDRAMFVSSLDRVVRSTDGGGSWTTVLPGVTGQLAISPDYPNDQTVYAGTDRGLFVTRNAGTTWTGLPVAPVSPTSFIEAVAVSPHYATDRTVIVSVQGSGLFRSADAGASFTFVGTSLADASVPVRDFNAPTSAPLVFSPAYASDRTIFGFGANAIVRSTDQGTTWSVVRPTDSSVLDDPPGPTGGRPAGWILAAALAALGMVALVALVAVVRSHARRPRSAVSPRAPGARLARRHARRA